MTKKTRRSRKGAGTSRAAQVPVYGTEPCEPKLHDSAIAKAIECLRLLGDQTECVAVSVSGYHLATAQWSDR